MDTVPAVVIFRKTDAPNPRGKGRAAVDELPEKLRKTKVNRKYLVDFAREGGFYNLPTVTQRQMDTADGRNAAVAAGFGFVVPKSNLGRKQHLPVDRSTCESIRIWIGQTLGGLMPPGSYSVIVADVPVSMIPVEPEDDES